MNEGDPAESAPDVQQELDQLIRSHCQRLDEIEHAKAMGSGFGIGALVGGFVMFLLVDVRSDCFIYGAVIVVAVITAVWCEGGSQKAHTYMKQERDALLARLPEQMRERTWDEYYKRVFCNPRDPIRRHK